MSLALVAGGSPKSCLQGSGQLHAKGSPDIFVPTSNLEWIWRHMDMTPPWLTAPLAFAEDCLVWLHPLLSDSAPYIGDDSFGWLPPSSVRLYPLSSEGVALLHGTRFFLTPPRVTGEGQCDTAVPSLVWLYPWLLEAAVWHGSTLFCLHPQQLMGAAWCHFTSSVWHHPLPLHKTTRHDSTLVCDCTVECSSASLSIGLWPWHVSCFVLFCPASPVTELPTDWSAAANYTSRFLSNFSRNCSGGCVLNLARPGLHCRWVADIAWINRHLLLLRVAHSNPRLHSAADLALQQRSIPTILRHPLQFGSQSCLVRPCLLTFLSILGESLERRVWSLGLLSCLQTLGRAWNASPLKVCARIGHGALGTSRTW